MFIVETIWTHMQIPVSSISNDKSIAAPEGPSESCSVSSIVLGAMGWDQVGSESCSGAQAAVPPQSWARQAEPVPSLGQAQAESGDWPKIRSGL